MIIGTFLAIFWPLFPSSTQTHVTFYQKTFNRDFLSFEIENQIRNGIECYIPFLSVKNKILLKKCVQNFTSSDSLAKTHPPRASQIIWKARYHTHTHAHTHTHTHTHTHHTHTYTHFYRIKQANYIIFLQKRWNIFQNILEQLLQFSAWSIKDMFFSSLLKATDKRA